MSIAQRYVDAMRAGNVDSAIAIEQKAGLFGYPPELVSVGLRAIDEGRDGEEAIDEYIDDLEEDAYVRSFLEGNTL